jgi:hypothetical protein
VFRNRASYLFTTLTLVSFLVGCGAGPAAISSGSVQLHGLVSSGQQGVSASAIQLWAAGSTGNGSAASPLISSSHSTVLSDADGNFTISGDYTCPASNPQVYITATGGNPGIAGVTSNLALVMMAALGPCNNLLPSTSVQIDELSTVAAAWAMAPFITGYANVGARSTNTSGIGNAVANAALLATGNSANFPSNLKVEGKKLDSLANILAACVNSDGTSACTPLFTAATPSGGTAPTNVLNAALNIVKNPGYNVTEVFQAGSSFVPFMPTLTLAPNDWTMSLTVTGGGLLMPNGMGIDAQSNIWVTGYSGPLSEFNAQGTPLSGAAGYPACFTPSSGTASCMGIEQATGLAIDGLGDIWIPNFNSPYNSAGSVTGFYGANSGKTGIVIENIYQPNVPTLFDNTIEYPGAISTNTNGQIFIANNEYSSATIWNTSGGLLYGDVGANLGLNSYPLGIAADSSGGFWLPDGSYKVAHITPNASTGATLISNTTCCSGSYGVATDAYGNVWITNRLGNSFSEVNDKNLPPNTTDGNVLINQASVGGVVSPGYLAIDAGQNVWIANGDNNTISEIAGNAGTLQYGTSTALPAGSAISPSASSNAQGGYGLDASLSSPYSIVPDEAGNIWVSNSGLTTSGLATITMFYGLATPTVTPIQPAPTAP